MKFKLMALILVVIVAIIGYLTIIGFLSPFAYFLILVGGYGYFVLMTLYFSWNHPKWYVKLYAVICSIWEFIFWGYGSYFGFLVYLLGITLPLIPLWFLLYEKYRNKSMHVGKT